MRTTGREMESPGFSDNVNPYTESHKMEASPVIQSTSLKSKPVRPHFLETLCYQGNLRLITISQLSFCSSPHPRNLDLPVS